MAGGGSISSLSGLAIRVYWLLIGNGILALSAIYIALPEYRLNEVASTVIFLNSALMILARWIDVCYFSGLTEDGEPATMKTWARYAMTLAGVTVAAWIVALGLSRLLG